MSDHHAILPTKGIDRSDLSALPVGEKNVLFLIGTRLLCAVCPELYRYVETAVTLDCAGTVFTAKGRTELTAGWKEIERAFRSGLKEKPEEEKNSSALPELTEGEIMKAVGVDVREGTTSPPKRYTEASLLSAMENAGAEEFSQIEDLERKGLGTPATRAGVIEKLVKSGFAERKSKQLIPTVRGMELIKILPDAVKSAKLTAEWETALKEVERGKRSPEDFMNGIARMADGLVKTYEGVSVGTEEILSGREAVGKCPRCGGNVTENRKGFCCMKEGCGFALWKNSRIFTTSRVQMTAKIAASLLKNGRVDLKNLHSEKTGKTYDATLVLEDTGEGFVNFHLEFPGPKEEKKADGKRKRGK